MTIYIFASICFLLSAWPSLAEAVSVSVNFAIQLPYEAAVTRANSSTVEHSTWVSSIEKIALQAFPQANVALVDEITACYSLSSCGDSTFAYDTVASGLDIKLSWKFTTLRYFFEGDIVGFVSSNSSALYGENSISLSEFTGYMASVVVSTSSETESSHVILPLCESNCDVGSLCETNSQCSSGICATVCQQLNCADGIHNGDEEDVDCGGSCIEPCTTAFGELLKEFESRETWELVVLGFSISMLLVALSIHAFRMAQYRWYKIHDPLNRRHILSQTKAFTSSAQRVQPKDLNRGNRFGKTNRGALGAADDKVRHIETCHLLADSRMLEGWLELRTNKYGRWQKQYCILFGGPSKVFCCFDDMVEGDQNNVYVGERIRLSLSSITNVAVPDEEKLILSSVSRFKRLWNKLLGMRYSFVVLFRQDEDATSSFVASHSMEALQLRSSTSHDREQWVGVLRKALFDQASSKRNRIQVNFDDFT